MLEEFACGKPIIGRQKGRGDEAALPKIHLKKPSKKNPHRGSTFDSFLAEESILEDVTTAALKRVLAWQLAELMKKRRISKSEMAKRMRTSRAALERLLDSENTSVTLQTMGRAAAALGKTLTVSFKDAA